MLTRLLSVILFFIQLFFTGVLIAAVQIGGLVAVAELLVIIAAEVVAAISNLFVIRIRTGLSSLREVAASAVGAAASDELSCSGEATFSTADAKESAVDSGDVLAARLDRRELEGIKKTASGRRRSASSREATARIKELLVNTSDGHDFFGGAGSSKRWRSGSGRKRAASGREPILSGQMMTGNEALAGHDNGWMITKRELISDRELTGNAEDADNSEFIHGIQRRERTLSAMND
jgi:hypothetical protein